MKFYHTIIILIIFTVSNCSSLHESFFPYGNTDLPGGYAIDIKDQIKRIYIYDLDSLLRNAKLVEAYLDNQIMIKGRDVSAVNDSILFSTYGERYSIHFGKVDYIIIDDIEKIKIGFDKQNK
ncbi:MAG: hypothetical protein Q8L01_03630 [Candidatus Woesebacteria bacterium]|nr:hypothetical protein [Candidatus Woesebacteria bacterium]